MAIEATNKSNIIFFKKLFILLFLLVATDILLGGLLEFFYLRMKTGQTARINYAVTRVDANILIFGSSRATHTYIPTILEDSLQESTYNVGINGQSLFSHYCILRTIQARVNPKIIILDLNLNEFEYSIGSYDRLRILLPYYKSNKSIQPILNLRSRYEKLKTISKLYRYNSFILPIIINNIIDRKDESIKGYLPLRQKITKSLIPNVADKTAQIDSVKVRIFKSFLQEASKENCKVFVFISPIFQNQKSVSSTSVIADSICHRENIPLINHSTLPNFINNPEYFQDVLHLNNGGAEIYTRLISKEIKDRIRFHK